MPNCPTPIPKCLLLAVSSLLGAHAIAQIANAPQPANSAFGYRIAGTVVNKIDASPLSRSHVIVRDARNPQKFQSIITSENGRFEFNNLPAGKYSLEGSKRGFIPASYDQHEQFSTAIVTGAGLDTENLVLKLAPQAVITGKIFDEAGEPVRHASVTLYRDNHQQGVDQILTFRQAQTDDQGIYEMAQLMPGTYFLSTNSKPWYQIHPPPEPANSATDARDHPAALVDRSLDVAYPATYYADVTDADSATPIPIRGGERLQVDIHLNPVPALRLIFHVSGDNNRFAYPQIEQPAFDGSTPVQPGGANMISPGVWELAGIPAGRYNLRIPQEGTTLQLNGLDLSKDGAEIDTSAAEPMSHVKVSVQMSGGTTIPKGLLVGLRTLSRVSSPWQEIDAKGEADFQQLAAGRYEVVAAGPGSRYAVAHISAEGAEVSGHTLTIPAGASLSLSLTVAAGSTEIAGTARRAGKAFAGAMVVLVPKNPEGNRDLFRRDQSDLDGTFTLQSVIPGSYKVLAIENGWDLDWSQPAVIAAYAKNAKPIEVPAQTHKPLNLTEPIEVQSK